MSADHQEIEARDRRVALHEAAHLTVGRALGASYGGATINENSDLGFSGLCWGPDFQSRLAGSTSSIIDKIDELMPDDGDPRDEETAPIFQHVVNRVTELCAGSQAEALYLGDAWPATDDRRQEQQLAGLIFSNRDAAATFISACALEARAILQRHVDVLEALTAALLEHRMLDGTQIDETISRAMVARQLAEEQQRRKRWREVKARADLFMKEQHGM